MTPEELEDLEVADAAEKAAGRSFGGSGDFGEAPEPSRGSFLLPYREDEGAYATPGSVVSPRERSATAFGKTQEPSAAGQYLGLLGENLAKPAAEALGVIGDVNESLGTIRRFPGRVFGNTAAGEPAFKMDEFKGAMSDLAAPLRRLGYWNWGMLTGPQQTHGLAAKTLGESMEAIQGPFESEDERIKLKPGVTPWGAAKMVGGGMAGLASEFLSLPGHLAPGVANPAESAGRGVASLASKAGLPNPTVAEAFSGAAGAARGLLGDIANRPGTGINFPSRGLDPRRGVLNLGKGPHKPEDLAYKRIIDAADEIAGVKNHLSGNIPQHKQDLLDAMIGPATSSPEEVARHAAMTPAELKQALTDYARSGKQDAKRAGGYVEADASFRDTRTQTPIDELMGREADETLGLSPAAEEEFALLGAEAPKAKVAQPRAAQGITEESASIIADRVIKQAMGLKGPPPDDAQIFKDFNQLPSAGKNVKTDWTARVVRELGGKPGGNKGANTAEFRRLLAERSKAADTTPPTNPEGMQKADEWEKVAEAEAAVAGNATGTRTPGEIARDAVVAEHGEQFRRPPQWKPEPGKDYGDSFEEIIDNVIKERGGKSGLTPIHEIRNAVRASIDDEAAGEPLTKYLQENFRRDDAWRLIPISDLSTAKHGALEDSIEGIGDTLYYVEPREGWFASRGVHDPNAKFRAPPIDIVEPPPRRYMHTQGSRRVSDVLERQLQPFDRVKLSPSESHPGVEQGKIVGKDDPLFTMAFRTAEERPDRPGDLLHSLESITMSPPSKAGTEVSAGGVRPMTADDQRLFRTLMSLEKRGWKVESLPDGRTRWTAPEGFSVPPGEDLGSMYSGMSDRKLFDLPENSPNPFDDFMGALSRSGREGDVEAIGAPIGPSGPVDMAQLEPPPKPAGVGAMEPPAQGAPHGEAAEGQGGVEALQQAPRGAEAGPQAQGQGAAAQETAGPAGLTSRPVPSTEEIHAALKRQRLRESFAETGKTVFSQNSEGGFTAGNQSIPLSPTAEEAKAARRALLSGELADTTEERIAATLELREALRPALERALSVDDSAILKAFEDPFAVQAPAGTPPAGELAPPPSPSAPGGGGSPPVAQNATGPEFGPTELPIRERMARWKAEQTTNPSIQMPADLKEFDQWERLGVRPPSPDSGPFRTEPPDVKFGQTLFGEAVPHGIPEQAPFTPAKYGRFRQGWTARTVLDRQKNFSEPAYLTEQGKAVEKAGGALANDEFVSRVLDVRKTATQAATPLMKEGMKSTEAVWADFKNARDAAFKEHVVGGDPDFTASQWDLMTDADLREAAGFGRGPFRTGNKAIDDLGDTYRKMFDETGKLADGVLVQWTPQGPRHFRWVGGNEKNRQMLNYELEFLGKRGDPDWDKLAAWIAKQPANQKAGVTEDFLDQTFAAVMRSADRQEAMEKIRAIPVIPTFMKSADGTKSLVINRGAYSFFPSPTHPGGRGINDWHLAQHTRVEMIRNGGTPGVNVPGEPPRFLDHWTPLLERMNAESGYRASSSANQTIAGLLGNTDMAGWNAVIPLDERSMAGRVWDATLSGLKRLMVAKNSLLSPFQPTLAVPQYAPGLAGPWVEVAKTALSAPKNLGGQLLRKIGLGKLADTFSTGYRELAPAAGIAREDFAAAVLPYWKNVWSNPGLRSILGQKHVSRVEAPNLEYRMRTMNPLEPLMTAIDSLSEATAAGNDVGSLLAGRREAALYLDRAPKHGVSFADEAKLDQLGVSPSTVAELKSIKKGVTPRPGFEQELAEEIANRLTVMTQQRGMGPLDSQRFLNDKTAQSLTGFQRYGLNMVRDTEREIRQQQALWMNPDLSFADKSREAGKLANKTLARLTGAFVQGEMRRQVFNIMGKDDVDWEQDHPVLGRIVMNLLYANLIGPYALVLDMAAKKAGVPRFYATRGGKEEKASDLSDLLLGPGVADKVFSTAAETAGRVAEKAGVIERTHPDDKGVLSPIIEYGANTAAGQMIGRPVMGNEAFDEAFRPPQSGRRRRAFRDELDALAGNRKRSSAIDELRKGLDLPEARTRRKRQSIDELLKLK